MTTIPKINPDPFVKIFSDRFANGQTSFDRMSTFFIRSIESLNREIQNSIPDSENSQNLIMYKAVNAKILSTAYIAQRHYLDNCALGKIENGFQSILRSLFGVISSLERASEMLINIKDNPIPLPANDEGQHNQAVALVSSVAKAEMARFIAMEENETLWFSHGENPLQPSRILIAKPDGKVYDIFSTALESSGGSRSFYKVFLHDGSCKVVGGLTNISSTEQRDAFFINDDTETLQSTKDAMKEEYSLLKDLREIPGIIRVYDHLSLSIAGSPVGFTMMRYNQMDLLDFMNDIFNVPNGYRPSYVQKINFMISLATILTQLHAKGLIHRDIKPENFVVKFDKSGNPVPTAIDFTSCIPKDDTEQRSKFGSTTILYWPPEYFDVSLYQKGHLTTATTQHMDTWALGLIFFQFYYGESLMDLLTVTRKFTREHGDEEFIKSLNAALVSGLTPFKKEMGRLGDDPYIKGIQSNWQPVWQKIDENREIWTQIILPMLSVDPAKRPTMAQLLENLEDMKEQPKLKKI